MRTFRLALLAFVVGFLLIAVGASQLRFLWNAYQHAGL